MLTVLQAVQQQQPPQSKHTSQQPQQQPQQRRVNLGTLRGTLLRREAQLLSVMEVLQMRPQHHMGLQVLMVVLLAVPCQQVMPFNMHSTVQRRQQHRQL